MSCAIAAVATLPLRAALAYDPTAWLVWGRELLHGELDTTGGPSWKPLPVVITTVLAPLGELADEVWLVVARAAALFALVVAFRLAARYAGPVAGVMAAAALVLTPDGGPRFVRLFAEGHAEPATAALTLFALERHLDGRRDHAALLGVALALLRPEAWPFLGAYALWLWWREPSCRRVLALSLPLIPLLWFGGDWLGSGSPLHGADAAQVVAGESDRVTIALERAWKVVVLPVWVAAVVGVVSAVRRRERELVVAGVGAVAWSAIVVAMTVVLGYAALSRFYLPAAAVVCVLGGIGAVRAVDGRVALAVAAVAVSAPFAVPRAVHAGELFDEIADRHDLDRALDVAIERAGGAEVVLGCDRVAIEPSELPAVALAEQLDVPLGDVGTSLRRRPGVYLALAGGRQDTRLAERDGAAPLGRSSRWAVYAVGCAPLSS